MEGPISPSATSRLPSAIKELDETCQKAYIYLRLKKSGQAIANHLNLSLETTNETVETIRQALSKAGRLDLIEDPPFVSIHADDSDTQDLPIVSNEIDVDKKLIIKEFLSFLEKAISELPKDQSRLLRLRYKHQMSARDIVGFCNKMGFNIVPGKDHNELKEQDIVYVLNKTMKDVLARIKVRYEDNDSFGMDNLKYIFEEFGI